MAGWNPFRKKERTPQKVTSAAITPALAGATRPGALRANPRPGPPHHRHDHQALPEIADPPRRRSAQRRSLLIAAGDNPDRLHSEASFAALCGVNPLEASSGKTSRRRLNRGGDRQANCALYRIAICRLSCEARTRDYLTRRITEGKTRREAIRCLKRYLAREIYQIITSPPPAEPPAA